MVREGVALPLIHTSDSLNTLYIYMSYPRTHIEMMCSGADFSVI